MIRVLIVEDQAILRESLARSVGDQPDMTVVAAIADASEALGVALKERPDMILMDVCTEHDSNGIVAAARIKEQLPECRIIIMTGMPGSPLSIRLARRASIALCTRTSVSTSCSP